ncbi:MAG: dUTP diphosphatase [Leptothrix sp. (in: b-proteobacteria)]
MNPTLRIKRLHPDAVLPVYASEGAACFDLISLTSTTIPMGMAATLETGLAFEIPPGCVMEVFSRSGHGFKSGVRLCNSVGIIDSDYRGQVMVRLQNDGQDLFHVLKGDRVAQAMLRVVPRVEFEVVEMLSETARGAGGLGSTGA